MHQNIVLSQLCVCVKVNVYFSWAHTVYFFLPVCLETSVHWQQCENGRVPAGMGQPRGRAPKDHRGPQLSWATEELMSEGVKR